jgi:peptidoglycan pentaglycine glycine transferase (the first glycine)
MKHRGFRARETGKPYQTRISDETEDPDWDAFLLKTPGGHYTQTSLWTQAKTFLGWRAVRIVSSQRDHIVAEVQLMIRPLPFGGTISHVPGGPLVVQDDHELTQLVITQMHQVAKCYRVQYLLVEPPRASETLAHELLRQGYRPSSRHAQATAPALLDLTQDVDHILRAMRKSIRHNIRLSQRKGMSVRAGNEGDLHTFYSLAMTTCKRTNLATFLRSTLPVCGDFFILTDISDCS